MANITVAVSESNVTVSETPLAITVNDTTNTISVTEFASNVAVTSTTSNIVVSETSIVSNVQVRSALSVTDTGYDLGSLNYSNANGVFTFVGVDNSQIRGLFSNTSPITYDSSTGVIGLEQTLDYQT